MIIKFGHSSKFNYRKNQEIRKKNDPRLQYIRKQVPLLLAVVTFMDNEIRKCAAELGVQKATAEGIDVRQRLGEDGEAVEMVQHSSGKFYKNMSPLSSKRKIKINILPCR